MFQLIVSDKHVTPLYARLYRLGDGYYNYRSARGMYGIDAWMNETSSRVNVLNRKPVPIYLCTRIYIRIRKYVQDAYSDVAAELCKYSVNTTRTQ